MEIHDDGSLSKNYRKNEIEWRKKDREDRKWVRESEGKSFHKKLYFSTRWWKIKQKIHWTFPDSDCETLSWFLILTSCLKSSHFLYPRTVSLSKNETFSFYCDLRTFSSTILQRISFLYVFIVNNEKKQKRKKRQKVIWEAGERKESLQWVVEIYDFFNVRWWEIYWQSTATGRSFEIIFKTEGGEWFLCEVTTQQ